MTPTECVKLCTFIAARCPAMRMQDETPDAWYVDLRDFDLGVALEAARQATLNQTFIGIGDLVRGCEAIVRREEGRRRIADLEEQIAAENPGAIVQRIVPAIEGRPVPVDAQVRQERRRSLREAAHTKRERVEQESAQAQAHREAMAQANAELEPLRAALAEPNAEEDTA